MNENLARRFEAVDSQRSLRAASIEGGRMVLDAIRSGKLPEMESLAELIEAAIQNTNPMLRETALLSLWNTYALGRTVNPHDVRFSGGDGVFVGSSSDDIKARAWNFATICRSNKKQRRLQPDHEITAWYRVHHRKYKTKSEAVRAYLQMPKGSRERTKGYESYYTQLDNDLRKRPLKPKKKQ